jgi:hypothetical protein
MTLGLEVQNFLTAAITNKTSIYEKNIHPNKGENLQLTCGIIPPPPFSEHLKKSLESLDKARLKENQRSEYRKILSQSILKIAEKTDKKDLSPEAITAGLIPQKNSQV